MFKVGLKWLNLRHLPFSFHESNMLILCVFLLIIGYGSVYILIPVPTCKAGLAHGWWVVAWGSCPAGRDPPVSKWKDKLYIQHDYICQPRTFANNLLACWAILLVGYNGKVTSYCPQAGEDLQDRNKRLNVRVYQMWRNQASYTCHITEPQVSPEWLT